MSEALENIKREIAAHPRERNGFALSDIDALLADEKKQAIKILIDAVSEGMERCVQPLKWLTRQNFLSVLDDRISKIAPADHGYFYLSYFAYLETYDSQYIENMKKAIVDGDKNWDMRRSALGRNLREILKANRDYAEFCKEIALFDPDPFIKKTALIGVLEFKKIDTNNYRLLPEHQYLLKQLQSIDNVDQQKIATELERIMDA
jgi:hypothetical protein